VRCCSDAYYRKRIAVDRGIEHQIIIEKLRRIDPNFGVFERLDQVVAS